MLVLVVMMVVVVAGFVALVIVVQSNVILDKTELGKTLFIIKEKFFEIVR